MHAELYASSIDSSLALFAYPATISAGCDESAAELHA
jgi:hypothetical protein